MADTEKLKEIVNLLPGENCGKCGFENCGKFALALVEGKAKPTECRKSNSNLKEIYSALGIEVSSEQELQVTGRVHGNHTHVHHGHHKHNGHIGHGRHESKRLHPVGHHSKHKHTIFS